LDQLTLGHPRWPEFIGRLEQRLNVHEQSDEPGKSQWLCGKDGDPFAYTREVLTAMGLNRRLPSPTFAASGMSAVTARSSSTSERQAASPAPSSLHLVANPTECPS
jgi:hypothetical protein